MTVHKNSLASYKTGIKDSFKNRSQQIFEVLYFGRKKMTDYEILQVFKAGSDNRNLIAPRVTGMVDEGVLEEVGTKIEHGRPVRICAVKWLVEEKQQVELF